MKAAFGMVKFLIEEKTHQVSHGNWRRKSIAQATGSGWVRTASQASVARANINTP
jgi:hypothetical protein